MSDNELFKIPEEALKKIKTQAEFEDFIQRLYKQGVEALLKTDFQSVFRTNDAANVALVCDYFVKSDYRFFFR